MLIDSESNELTDRFYFREGSFKNFCQSNEEFSIVAMHSLSCLHRVSTLYSFLIYLMRHNYKAFEKKEKTLQEINTKRTI